jgi:hypothetical protein
LQELIELVSGPEARRIEFVYLRKSIDTTTLGRKLMFHVCGLRYTPLRALPSPPEGSL